MPGINTSISFNNSIQTKKSAIDEALVKMNYDKSYTYKNLCETDWVISAFSGYPEYCTNILESSEYIAIIDGAIYNKTNQNLKKDFQAIIPLLQSDTSSLKDYLKIFQLETDGEYVIHLIDLKTKSAVIFNDIFGRLPLYYYSDKEVFYASRAMKFIVNQLSNLAVNPRSLIGYFTFMAPLGNLTFIENIYKLLPASMILVNTSERYAKEYILYDNNFDNRHEHKPIKEYTDYLLDSFMKATLDRNKFFADRKSLLALSGGLDSRAVLMALLKNNQQFGNVTFTDGMEISNRDIPVVNKLANKYQLKSEVYTLPKDDLGYMEKLIDLKDGLSVSGIMGTVMQSLEIIIKNHGKNIVYYTGDGGGYMAGPRYTGKKIESQEELINKLISRLSLFKIEEIFNILGIKSADFYQYLHAHFETYPEKVFDHKYDRFYLYEHLFRFSMEGEDRVRYYFWLTTPFYSADFTTYAYKIPNKYLNGWQIYREFLKALDRDCVNIKYANWGLPINSPWCSPYLWLRGIATENIAIKNKIIKALRLLKIIAARHDEPIKGGFNNVVSTYLKQQIKNDSVARDIINTKYIANLLDNKLSLFQLYTLTNIIKYFNTIKNLIK